MTTSNGDVVIVGGGIVGMATSYYLGKAGVRTTVLERDSVGSHASGFAYGGLGPLNGTGIPGPVYPVAKQGAALHHELSQSLPEETGVNIEYRMTPSLGLAFTEQELKHVKDALPWQQQQEGFSVRWVEPAEIRSIEPRVSESALGGVYTEGTADVEPYRLVLALAQAAEKMGGTIRHGTVKGLRRTDGHVSGVVLDSGEIACDHMVLAMEPCSGQASSWLGVPIGIEPLKGQIIRVRAPGAPFRCTIGWAGSYTMTKPDGLLWAGTTEEEAGFDENPTTEARDEIMAARLKMVPSLTDAQLIRQTACLRPVATDGTLVLGRVPGWEGGYMATGGERKGILLGPAMARITADLITKGASDTPIDAFDPGRFAA